MRIYPEQLGAHLAKGLAPVYLIHGDEPLLAQEAADAIRAAARKQGYGERVCFFVETGFDWNGLLRNAATASLFGERRILELRLGESKPGELGGKTLVRYADQPPPDAVLLTLAGKLDATEQKSRWFTALDERGITIPARPLDPAQLPAWIERRLRHKGLIPEAGAVALLAERVEGNLLAAAQEIDKLYLLLGPGPVGVEQIIAAVGDSARYSVYDLVDTALAGKAERTVRILRTLRGEGTDPVLVAWALHREIRLLALLAHERGRGLALDALFARHKVWDKRKALVGRALMRLPLAPCRRLLRDCARLDRVIKGAEPGDAWDEAMQLSLRLAGREWPTPVDCGP